MSEARPVPAADGASAHAVAERDKHERAPVPFEQAARQVRAEQVEPTARNDQRKAQWSAPLTTHAFPRRGASPVHAVGQGDVLRVPAPIRIEKPETARRVRQRVRTWLARARTAGRRHGIDPVEAMERVLPKQRDRARRHEAPV